MVKPNYQNKSKRKRIDANPTIPLRSPAQSDIDEEQEDKNDSYTHNSAEVEEEVEVEEEIEEEEEEEEEDEYDSENEDETQPTSSDVTSLRNVSFVSDGRYHNKQRCLTICSRGATARFRHLLEDLRTLIPHHKKDSKLDAKKSGGDSTGKAINDIAEMTGCNTALFLECRKHQDAYLWIGITRHSSTLTSSLGGPSAKFLIENVHTMDELRLTGNSMKGSRPILSFDTTFDSLPHLKILKCLFTDIFGTPRGHPKSKPFVDRVMGFYYADGKIWIRNYQIVEHQATNAKDARLEMKLHGQDATTSLVEIGPRFVLNPIRIFRGSFGGQTLYQNKDFVSPNTIRSINMRKKGQAYESRKDSQKKRKTYQEAIIVPENPLASVFK